MGVFDIEEIGGKKKKGRKKSLPQEQEAVVRNPRACTSCRECLREERLDGAVELLKKKQHYECKTSLIQFISKQWGNSSQALC